MDSRFHGNDRKENGNDRKDKTGLMNQAPTQKERKRKVKP